MPRGSPRMIVREHRKDGSLEVHPVTLKKTAAGWRATNALAADDTLDLVWISGIDSKGL